MNSTWIEHLPQWYLEWCWDNEALQTWWRTSAFPDDAPATSNINVGDRFTLGRSRQACIVSHKTSNIGKHTVGRNWFSYHIDGDRGGHWYAPDHDRISDGYNKFIPQPEQLVMLGYVEVAQRLLESIAERSTREKKAGQGSA